MAFRKPSRQSFFSSRISPFSPDDWYFYKMSKRTIWQVSRRIKDEQNWQYCEKCVVTGSQSHEIVHKIVHEHVETWETISVQPAQENYHFEKEKIDNLSFIAWKCWRQSSNHVVKRPHPHTLWNHTLVALVGRSSQLIWFFSKSEGNMHKILLFKIISYKIMY